MLANSLGGLQLAQYRSRGRATSTCSMLMGMAIMRISMRLKCRVGGMTVFLRAIALAVLQ